MLAEWHLRHQYSKYTFEVWWNGAVPRLLQTHDDICGLLCVSSQWIPCFLLLFYYSCPNFSPFAFLCPAHLPAPTVIPHAIVRVRGSFIHVLWLVPSSSFHHSPPPLRPLSVSCFHASSSILFVSLFCSLGSSYKCHMVKCLSLTGLFHLA